MDHAARSPRATVTGPATPGSRDALARYHCLLRQFLHERRGAPPPHSDDLVTARLAAPVGDRIDDPVLSDAAVAAQTPWARRSPMVVGETLVALLRTQPTLEPADVALLSRSDAAELVAGALFLPAVAASDPWISAARTLLESYWPTLVAQRLFTGE